MSSDPDVEKDPKLIYKHEDAVDDNLNSIKTETYNIKETVYNNDEILPFPEYADTVFKCITQESKPRYWMLMIIDSHWFEKISMFAIIMNCITMSMYEPCRVGPCDSVKCIFLKYTDDIIYGFFFVEMLMKIFAMGLIGNKSYLCDTWNRLDCFIVIAGATDYLSFSDNSGITAIRTIRVLRPLRAINKVPSMRILVTLIIDTIPMLGNVFMLAILIFTVFGIIGVQLWKGILRNRCFSSSLDYNSTIISNISIPHPFYTPEDDDFICGQGMQTCQDIPHEFSEFNYTICRPSDQNPFMNSISFDNIGYAFILIFQIITLENWTGIMYHVQNAHSQIVWIYFVFVIVIGSFFLLNMVLVVISVQFSETKEREIQLMMDEKKRLRRRSSQSSSSFLNDENNSWEGLLLLIGGLIKKACYKIFNKNLKKKRTRRSNKTARDTTSLRVLCCCCFKYISSSTIFKKIFDLRDKLSNFCNSQCFQNLILVSIVVNSIFMGIEHHEQPELLTTIVEYSNYIFTIIFFIEMLLKLFGFGIFGYIKDPLNVFDFLIVCVSIFEVFSDAEASGFSVLRTFRLLRLIKLFRFIPTLKRQIVVMMKTLDSVATFCFLVLLFIFIFSTLGMHLFGCKFFEYDDEGNMVHDRKNFNSLFWAMITIFQILTQEDWSYVMYMGMDKTSPWASLYFILLMVFGNYVLFSLLVAILVEGFSDVDKEIKQNSVYLIGSKNNIKLNSLNEIDGETNRSNDLELKEIANKKNLEVITTMSQEIAQPEVDDFLLNEKKQTTMDTQIEVVSESKESMKKSFHDNSLFIFKPKSNLRKKCLYIASHSWFSHIIFFIIFLNCITLAYERPDIKQDSCERRNLNVANNMFTFIFFIEMVLKVVAYGFISGKYAYLKDGWNRIDFFLVLCSLVDLLISSIADNNIRVLSLLKILRIMRTLRPLRAINNAPGLKLVVESLLSSLRPIGNTVLICCSFFIIFGILGVQLLKGKLYHCEGDNLQNITTKSDCLSIPNNSWKNSLYNYDNILNALFTLFILATLDGWVDSMYEGIDAVGIDMQPVENHNEYMAFFYLIYLLIVGFFVVNMFVGVVIDNFHKCCEDQSAAEIQRKEDRRIKKEKKRLLEELKIPYYIKYSPARRMLHDMVQNKYFDVLITFFILLNIIIMTIEYYMMPKVLIDILEYFNYTFTIIFLIEAIVRVISLGVKRYLKDLWNILDLFIVFISVGTIVINNLVDLKQLPVDPSLIRIIRIVRIARVFKLLKALKGIQSLINTVAESLLQVGNLALLFGLLFFIFSTLGVELFGKLTCDGRLGECEGINKHIHFNSFGSAFLTLFRVTTGDGWSALMKDALENNVVCMQASTSSSNVFIEINSEIEPQSWCLYSFITPVYFIFFVLSAQFILMNLVIAVLMKELEEANQEAEEDKKEAALEEIEKHRLEMIEKFERSSFNQRL